MLVRARDVRELPRHVEDMVAHRLARLGVATLLIDAERRKATRPVQIGATVDRSVLGIMVDFAKGVPYYLETVWDDGALEVVEDSVGGNAMSRREAIGASGIPKIEGARTTSCKMGWLTGG